MKRLSYLFVGVTLFSVLSTGCGNKASVVPLQYPQQTLQQVPTNNNPAYQQYPQTTGDYYQNVPSQKFPPDSPDMSNPANSNLPVNYQNNTPTSQYQNTILPETNPTVQPSSQPAATPAPKVPWYKKVIDKVKGIFKKST